MNRFLAEWEKQSAVLIAWPHATGDFSNRLESVEQTYSIIADTITQYQRLIIVCRDAQHQRHIEGLVTQVEDIDFVHAPVNDIWVRDTAFLSIEKNGVIHHLNFKFNGWGGKYNHDYDNALNHKLANAKPFKRHSHHDVDFVLEGGSVETDGQGTILTTRQCLLNPNRNPSFNQQQIEQLLAEQLGAKRVLWIDQPNLAGDDTDAHIDTLARFCSASTIAYSSCEDESDPHYASLKNMEAQLQALRTVSGEAYHLVPLPLPKPIFDEDDYQLPANYANFLIINHAVLVPVYDDANDSVALEKLANVFSHHKIIAIPCRPLVHQYGSLHCMTMQFPESL